MKLTKIEVSSKDSILQKTITAYMCSIHRLLSITSQTVKI